VIIFQNIIYFLKLLKIKLKLYSIEKISEWNIFLSKQEPNLIENLLLFDETKDLSKCNLVNVNINKIIFLNHNLIAIT
jgi:hypothetical protein